MNRTLNSDEYRTCTKCGKIFPNTNQYFSKNNGNGLNSICKACQSEKTKKRNKEMRSRFDTNKIEYSEEKICKKCGRSLPNSYKYFPIDKACVTGLRNVCRECNPNYHGFLPDDFEASKPWTQDEDQIIKKYYKDYTGIELHELFLQNRSVRAIESRASILGIIGKTQDTRIRANKHKSELLKEKLVGREMSEEWKSNISKSKVEYFKTHTSWWLGKHRSPQQIEEMRKRQIGKWAGDNNPRHINPLNGNLNGRWKGGTTPLYAELRSETKSWQKESMDFCGYHCVVTGGSFNNIHHTVAFRDIVDEAFNNLGLKIKERVNDYSDTDFDLLKKEIHYLHNIYGYGACVCKDVHKLFHDTYGYTMFTPYDFLDFIYKIDCGEYDKWFEENNLQININYDYVEYLESILQEMKSA